MLLLLWVLLEALGVEGCLRSCLVFCRITTLECVHTAIPSVLDFGGRALRAIPMNILATDRTPLLLKRIVIAVVSAVIVITYDVLLKLLLLLLDWAWLTAAHFLLTLLQLSVLVAIVKLGSIIVGGADLRPASVALCMPSRACLATFTSCFV